jgi:hypothetical protein
MFALCAALAINASASGCARTRDCHGRARRQHTIDFVLAPMRLRPAMPFCAMRAGLLQRAAFNARMKLMSNERWHPVDHSKKRVRYVRNIATAQCTSHARVVNKPK